MKLTLKTLNKEELQIEVDDSATVLAAKEKIAAKFGHEVAHQKLIYAGKILVDDNTVASYKIPESGFLVLLVRKTAAKPAAAKPKPAATSSPAPTPAAAATPAAAPAASATETPAPAAQPSSIPAPAPVSATEAPTTPAAAVTPMSSRPGAASPAADPAVEEMVSRICEMGFPDADVRAALRAAYNNPDRAVEFLMNGIPANLMPAQQAANSPVRSPGQGNVNASARAAGAVAAPGSPAPSPAAGNLFQMAQEAAQEQARGNPDSALDDLRSHPLFAAFRMQVQQNPALLSQMLAQLGSANPALLQRINANQEEFIAMMNEPVPAGTPSLEQFANSMGMGGAGGADAGGAPPGATYISVTPEEQEAIARLEQLGFPKHRVLEAYLACDKDETLAANYLLNQPMDDDDMPDA